MTHKIINALLVINGLLLTSTNRRYAISKVNGQLRSIFDSSLFVRIIYSKYDIDHILLHLLVISDKISTRYK